MTHSSRPVALVTGAARRVGLAIAREFARAGFDLVITYRTSADGARAAQTSLAQEGARVHLEPLDLDDPHGVEAHASRLAAALPRLDVLVHNASMYSATPLEELTADEALRAMRVNAVAPLVLSRHMAPRLRESDRPGGGAIVALVDAHAMGRPRRGYAAYSMSKAALAEMVRSLAVELAPHVRVNGVAPGVVAWPEAGAEAAADVQRAYLSRVPLRRPGTPEDAAGAVRWLAMDATYVTGEIVRLDGGRWLA